MTVCKIRDEDYILSNPIWVVTLNNNEVIYQDDGCVSNEEYSAWIRLKKYCQENNLYITDMSVGFRSNRYSLLSNADGYYFSRGARGAFGNPRTTHLFFAGTLTNGILSVTCWKVPEMLEEQTETRPIKENDPCLILHPNMLQSMVQKTP